MRISQKPGVLIRRVNVGAAKLNGHFVQFGKKGFFDTQGELGELALGFWIEVKTPEGKLEPEQETFRACLDHHKVRNAVVCSVEHAEIHIDEWLEQDKMICNAARIAGVIS